MSKWQFWVDRGGTFTDLVARNPAGQLSTTKLLSDNPEHYDDAVLAGICELMQVASVDAIPSAQIDCVRLGTTVATNALLERKGAPTLLVTTKGFGDALKIGYQNRPDLFALHIKLPEPLYKQVLEVDERLAADGSVVRALNGAAYEQAFCHALARGLSSVAVVFMHAYLNPIHELAIGEIAKKVGFTQITLSHQASALIRFVARGDTAVVDAYVSPILQNYIQSLRDRLPATRLLFMQSTGGLTEGKNFRGRNSLLSGPAGGVVGGVKTSAAEGVNKILGFDMGGTSTDVWHFSGGSGRSSGSGSAEENSAEEDSSEDNSGAGAYERVHETTLAGVRLQVPMMDIHTVAAGGGSVCYFDGSKLRVGPESAGAIPGPACYGRGGPLTITDCNLLLGKLESDYFPQVFGSSGREALDSQAAHLKISAIAAQIEKASGDSMSVAALAEGFVDIANAGMAGAIKKVSTQRGHNVEQYVLACFGGAAGQHACRVAERLGVQSVLIHPLAGVLSALGMGLAEIATLAERSVEWPITRADLNAALSVAITSLRKEVTQQLPADASKDHINWQEKVYLRYRGADTVIPLALPRLRPRLRSGPEAEAEAEAEPALSPPIMHEAFAQELRAAFEREHLAQFSFLQEGREVVIDSISSEAVLAGAITSASVSLGSVPSESVSSESVPPELAGNTPTGVLPPASQTPVIAVKTTDLYSHGQWRQAPVFRRESLLSHETIAGPAVIVESTGTTVVEAGWQAVVLASRSLQITRLPDQNLILGGSPEQIPEDSPERLFENSPERFLKSPERPFIKSPKNSLKKSTPKERTTRNNASPQQLLENKASSAITTQRNPVHLELFNYQFMSIAEQMGAVLARTAHSVNIKERLDFSCALFDGAGNLVANAPHVPVHLGSMGATVVQLIADRAGLFAPGDAYLVNSPYAGGTHLPDLTVVTPVFASLTSVVSAAIKRPDFFVATRAHHADIGGTTPGSIPPDSTSIEQEGVLFENFQLVKDGVFQTLALSQNLAAGTYPARNIEQNIADLQAQIAANVLGQNELQKLVVDYGYEVVSAYMAYVQDNAEEAVCRVIGKLNNGSFRTLMDNDAVIDVTVRVDRQKNKLAIDFSGTSPQQNNNFNAPAAVCRAAVLYVIRTLVPDAIPLNAGCLRPVDIRIPEDSMLKPRYPAAVVAGNVETSQAIADALYGALGVLACSQGTMNNFTFGNENYQYYETICGGAGAGKGFSGASAVQVHMTNSRLTDPEILELRFPVRLEAFSIRSGSGGAGLYTGGDGVVRQIRFLQAMTCSLVSSHRDQPTFGLAGGGSGKVGVNILVRASGEHIPLSGVSRFEVQKGDLLVIKTPGGGGFEKKLLSG